MERNIILEEKLNEVDSKIRSLENEKLKLIQEDQNLKTSEKLKREDDERAKIFNEKIENEKKQIIEKIKKFKGAKKSDVICPECLSNIDTIIDMGLSGKKTYYKRRKFIYLLNDSKIFFCPVCNFEMRSDFDFRSFFK